MRFDNIILAIEFLVADKLHCDFFFFLFGVEDAAESVFSAIENDYLETKELAFTAKRRPVIMHGVPFSGSWSILRGSIYVGAFY